jgi:hypothetical protein
VGDRFQRSGRVFVSGEKGDEHAGADDRNGKPDDAPKRPAKPIFFPHGDQRVDDNRYGQGNT